MATTSALQSVQLPANARILAIRVGDMGDALLATPMLRALRTRYPAARIDLLVSASAATLLAECPLIDELYTLPQSPPGSRASLGRLSSVSGGARLAGILRGSHYDAVIFANHLTLPSGRRWRRALAAMIGAPLTVGLDNGHGGFLRLRVPDAGFGARHEVEYALALAGSLDATLPDDERAPRVADLGWSGLQPVALRPARRRVSRCILAPAHTAWPAAGPPRATSSLPARCGVEFAASVTLVGGQEERDLAASIIESLGAPAWITSAAGATSPRQLAETLAGAPSLHRE